MATRKASKKGAGKRPKAQRQTKPKAQISLTELEQCAASGLTNEEIIEHLGVASSTFYKQKAENGEIGDAIKRGRLKAHLAVSDKLYGLCMSGNVTAIIWYEKSRRGLTDKINLSPEELDAAISRELERIAAAS